MILYEIVKEQIEARQRTRIAAHEARGEERGIKLGEERGIKLGEERGIKLGEERGIKLGEERGIRLGEERGIKLGEERGKELERDTWVDWLERRDAAAAAGEPFTEPNPAEKHNGTSPPAN